MDLLLWVMVIVLLAPATLVALECFFACMPGSLQQGYSNEMRPRLAVLIPAHNESAVIAAMLASVKPQLMEGDRLMLVADNCSDDTAAIARAAGAQVLERTNADLRGKGYALACGMDAMRDDPPELVVFIDADCLLQAGSLDALVKTAARLNAPIQALDIMQAGDDAGVRQKIAAFAWIVKNHVRALGQYRLGMPCPLMGTGMAFPWHIISRVDLATGALTEDMLLGGVLVVAGYAPVFCPAACVTSKFPESDEDAHTQRKRWEHGHLGMIFNHAPSLLLAVLKRGDLRGAFFVFDMMVPPLALQSMLMLLGLGITGIAAWFSHVLPFLAMLAGSALFGIALMLAWYRYARQVIGIRDALQIPAYIIFKISVYVSYIFFREKDWVKTKR